MKGKFISKLLVIMTIVCSFIVTPVFAKQVVTLSLENEDSFPWYMKNGEGLDYILLHIKLQL